MNIAHMTYQDFQFNYQNTTIKGQYAETQNPKGVFVLVHGFGEHSARYKVEVIPALLESNYNVMYYDNIGHGKSGGKRGHCPSYEGLQDILHMVVNEAKHLYPNLPLLLYGHSMGGNLVLNYVLKKDTRISAIVATSPYLRLAFDPPQWKVMIGKLMLKIAPSVTLPTGMDPSGISRRPEEVEKYVNDPLVHHNISPMYSFPIMDAGEWAIEHAGQLKIKTLLLHGTADPIIDYKATVQFDNNCTSSKLHLLEGGYHELHKDLCSEEMLHIIKNWI